MNLKINQHYIYIIIFTSFFFLWGIDLVSFVYLFTPPDVNVKIFIQNLTSSETEDNIYYKSLSGFKLSYLIILLLIPIFYNLIRKKDYFLNGIFNYQKYIIFFTLLSIANFCLTLFISSKL